MIQLLFSDSIAARGERLELLVDKTDELNENVSTDNTIYKYIYIYIYIYIVWLST